MVANATIAISPFLAGRCTPAIGFSGKASIAKTLEKITAF